MSQLGEEEEYYYNVGQALTSLSNGVGITKNCSGKWVVTVHDGEEWSIHVNYDVDNDGQFDDPLDALESVQRSLYI